MSNANLNKFHLLDVVDDTSEIKLNKPRFFNINCVDIKSLLLREY